MTAEAPLPRVSVQYPRQDSRGRWKLENFHVSEAEDATPEALRAALDHILHCPDETLRRVPRGRRKVAS